jgi:hypothetical protein
MKEHWDTGDQAVYVPENGGWLDCPECHRLIPIPDASQKWFLFYCGGGKHGFRDEPQPFYGVQ